MPLTASNILDVRGMIFVSRYSKINIESMVPKRGEMMLPHFMINNMQEPFAMGIERILFHKRHWHDNAFEFVLVLKGSINASLSTENYKLKEDDLLIVSPEDVHSFSMAEEDNIVLFLQINFEYFHNVFPNISHWILDSDPMSRTSDDFELGALRYYLSKIYYRLPHSKNPLVELIPLLSFCEEKFQSTNMVSKKADVSQKQMDFFYEIDDYIYSHFTELVQLSDISEFLNYSKYHFSHLVKKITGMNFLEYLNHVRVLAAERFLIATDKKISEIAFECGFTDIRSLNRYFKKWYQCTPSEYRKLYCESDETIEIKPKKFTLQDHQVKEKLDLYISKLEVFKTINLQKMKEVACWNMPDLVCPDNIKTMSEQKQLVLKESLKECKIERVIYDDFSENEIIHVPELLKSVLEGKVKSVDMFGEKGMVEENGIKKPLYFAFFFLSKISKTLSYLEEGFAVGCDDSGIQILLYNSVNSDETGNYMTFEILLSNVKHDYKVTKYHLDKENGNAFHYLNKFDGSYVLSSNDEELIRKITFPKVSFEIIRDRNNIKFFESLSLQSAILITLEKLHRKETKLTI